MQHDYAGTIQRIYEEIQSLRGQGAPASYIPELAKVQSDQIGLCVQTLEGKCFGVGAYQTPFSTQSISKLFTFVQAIQEMGEHLWSRVGNEPSGNTFNSLVQLENENGIPRNPFINAGALVISDVLLEIYDDPYQKLLDLIRELSGNPHIHFDEKVALSEIATGHRNAALAHFMKSFGTIHCEVEDVLRFYCYQCSIAMSCEDLSKSVLFLANQGVNPQNGQVILNPSRTKRTGALLMTSGLYNESGDFAYRVGIPAKSGVGGGIAGFVPQHFGTAVWCPELNSRGNSLIGIQALELLTTYSGVSVF